MLLHSVKIPWARLLFHDCILYRGGLWLFRPTVSICSGDHCILRTCYHYNYMCNARPDYWLYFSSTFLPGTITGILIYQAKYKQLVFGYATIVSSPPLRVSNRWSVSISHPWGHQVRFLSGLYTPFGLVPARSYISTHEELYFAGRDSIIYQLYWVRLFRVTSVQLTTTQSSYCVYLTPLCYAMTIDFWTLKPEDLNTGTLLVMSFIAWSGWYLVP